MSLKRQNARNLKLASFCVVLAAVGVLLLWRGFAATTSSPDLNGDGKVDIRDLTLQLVNFGKNSSTGDLNGDGKVTIQDLSLLLIAFGKPVNPNPPPPPPGQTLYVATSGSDSNDGSQNAPFKTIAKAVDTAQPGYTVLVGNGTYDGNIAIDHGGAAGKYLTIRAQNRWGAIINGNGNTSKQAAVELNADYVRIQDLTITGELGVREGILIGANNLQIVGNHIHQICNFLTDGTSWKGGAGIDISIDPSHDLIIDANQIDHVGAPGSDQQLVHGMYLSSHVTNGNVTNNLIFNIEDFGLHPYDETEASGWHFINNTIAFTGRGILQAPNGVTRNNIVYKTRGDDYVIRGSGNVLSNNISFGTGSTTSESGVQVVDPKLVSPKDDGSGDFHLQAGSPAIDAGTATDAPAADFLGIKRPQGSGIDIGAFEFQ